MHKNSTEILIIIIPSEIWKRHADVGACWVLRSELNLEVVVPQTISVPSRAILWQNTETASLPRACWLTLSQDTQQVWELAVLCWGQTKTSKRWVELRLVPVNSLIPTVAVYDVHVRRSVVRVSLTEPERWKSERFTWCAWKGRWCYCEVVCISVISTVEAVDGHGGRRSSRNVVWQERSWVQKVAHVNVELECSLAAAEDRPDRRVGTEANDTGESLAVIVPVDIVDVGNNIDVSVDVTRQVVVLRSKDSKRRVYDVSLSCVATLWSEVNQSKVLVIACVEGWGSIAWCNWGWPIVSRTPPWHVDFAVGSERCHISSQQIDWVLVSVEASVQLIAEKRAHR